MKEITYDLRYVYDDEVRGDIYKWIKDYSRNEPLKVLSVDNATILPRKLATQKEPYTWMGLGGVVDQGGNYVSLSGIKHILEDAYVFGGKYDYDTSNVEYMDEEVVYIGPMLNHWGHYIYEFITRLWYCYKNETGRIAYCGWGFDEGKLHGSYGRFFELLGIDTSKLVDIRKPTRFRKVIIPEQSYLRNQYVMPEYREMLEYAYNRINSDGLKPYKKVYFTRASFIKNSNWYREHGEEVIEKTFKLNGFKVFDPAKLTLDQQIFYMHNCEVVALIGSSTGADTAFMRENTDRIYIKKGFYMDPDLSQLDYATNAGKVTVVDCWLRPYKSYKASHSAGPNLIGGTKCFYEFLRSNNMKPLPKKDYVRSKIGTYIWFIMASVRNMIFNLLYPIYYKSLRKLIRGK